MRSQQRRWAVLSVGFLLVAAARGAYAQDFRGVKWGATEAEVIAAEGSDGILSLGEMGMILRVADPDERIRVLTYERAALDQNSVRVQYEFSPEGALRRARYVLEPNPKLVKALKEALARKYGNLMHIVYSEGLVAAGYVVYERGSAADPQRARDQSVVRTLVTVDEVDHGSEVHITYLDWQAERRDDAQKERKEAEEFERTLERLSKDL